ncbi:MAG TPA: sulfatase [Rugosimonospora sp.]|nr:sulfatase [Rugosimonospora sp.]
MEAPAAAAKRKPLWRRVLGWVATVIAFGLVFYALVSPNRLSDLHPRAFVRIPVEGIVAIVLVVVLPRRPRQLFIVFFGISLGLLTILKFFDMGFYFSLDRTFDPVPDWPLLGDAVNFVQRSLGKAAAVGAVVLAIVLIVAVMVLMTLSVRRLSRIVVRHRTAAIRFAAVCTAAWVACTLGGVQIMPKVRVASRSAAGLGVYRAVGVVQGLLDSKTFLAQIASDPYRDTPANQLLTALRGKDVMITFVESYGRTALQDPGVNAVLDAGNARLAADGFASRSAFFTSPTFGGGSWLAHSTLQTGLWIDGQQRYTRLLTSARFTLSGAFQRAGWRTVDVIPADNKDWPGGKFYHFNQMYPAGDLGYKGPLFNFGSPPDQYTLSMFQHTERAPGHQPVMAELDLLSSHAPWTPLPHITDWNAIGDGSVYKTMPADRLGRARPAYLQSIRYSLSAVISYLETYGDPNLVFIFLGDHQPAPLVSGDGAPHEGPVTIITRDKALLDRIDSWGWQSGIKPGPQAPLWRMDTFRDKFLAAFGPQGGPAPTPSPSTGR